MERLGAPRPPAVALGDRVVHGWNPEGYAALLGVAYRAAGRLPPAALAARLDRVLESAQRLIERFDARQMDHVPPERARTVRDLAYHVYRVGLGKYPCQVRPRPPVQQLAHRSNQKRRARIGLFVHLNHRSPLSPLPLSLRLGVLVGAHRRVRREIRRGAPVCAPAPGQTHRFAPTFKAALLFYPYLLNRASMKIYNK